MARCYDKLPPAGAPCPVALDAAEGVEDGSSRGTAALPGPAVAAADGLMPIVEPTGFADDVALEGTAGRPPSC